MVMRAVVYAWAAPASALGVLCAVVALLTGGQVGLVGGVLEASGGLLRPLLRLCPYGPAAMTLGHVVIGLDTASLDVTRSHERAHVRQYERWGPLFIPAYLCASLVAALRGQHPYLDNPFERQADEASLQA